MKLSIVIICWNDRKVIGDCLRSICAGTRSTEIEIIVSVNGSADGSVEFIRENFPNVRVIENGANLGFSKGNNVGIRACRGEFVLILNPDTIIHDGTLDGLVQFAERHPEAGAFGCRVLNVDGSYQRSARPFPTIWRYSLAALYLGSLGHLSEVFTSDEYVAWAGDSEREVDWLSGCSLLVRGDLLRRLGGFDEQFVYYFEDVDLCRRVRQAGYPVLFTPEATITHLGGQSTKEFPLPFVLEKYRNSYRYFYKHFGKMGARRYRRVVLTRLSVRRLGYSLVQWIKPSEAREKQMNLLRVAFRWNKIIDPVRLIENGEEPDFGVKKTFELA
jgi:GT2 family glycosyltransferase